MLCLPAVPLYKQKVYLTSDGQEGITVEQARAQGVPLPRSLAPQHVRITSTVTRFLDIHPGTQPTPIFQVPATCKC